MSNANNEFKNKLLTAVISTINNAFDTSDGEGIDVQPPLYNPRQYTKDEAIIVGEWIDETVVNIWGYPFTACLQLHQRLMCMKFGLFHKAIEETLGYPVFTHQFADVDFIEHCKKVSIEKTLAQGYTTPDVNTILLVATAFKEG